MGSRNLPKREPKKPRKDARKATLSPPATIIAPPPVVEVIKKGKKAREWEEEGEEK